MENCKKSLTRSLACLGLALPWCVLASPFVDTFGTSATRIPSPYVPQLAGAGAVSHYKFADSAGSKQERDIDDGYYAVVKPSEILVTGGAGYWQNGNTGLAAKFTDHTGDNGAVIVFNAGLVQNDLYRRVVTLDPNQTYTLEAWRFLVNGPTDLLFKVNEPDDSAVLTQSPNFVTGNLPADIGNWKKITWTFRTGNCVGPQQYAVKLVNDSAVVQGNDFFLDDLALKLDPGAVVQGNAGCTSALSAKVTAGDDSASTTVGVPVTFPLLGNDTTSDAVHAALGIPTQHLIAVKNGTVVFNADKTVTYTPNAGFVGQDAFTYQICSVASAAQPTPICAEATARVVVVGPGAANSIPTLSEWGVLLMSTLMAMFGVIWLRRRAV